MRQLLSPACEKHEINLKHIMAWLIGGMDKAPMDEIEAAVGRIAIDLPAAGAHDDLSNEIVHAAKEYGDVFAVMGQVSEP